MCLQEALRGFTQNSVPQPTVSTISTAHRMGPIPRGTPGNLFDVVYNRSKSRHTTLKAIQDTLGIVESTIERIASRLIYAGSIKKPGTGGNTIVEATLQDASKEVVDTLRKWLMPLTSNAKISEVQGAVRKAIEECGGTIKLDFNSTTKTRPPNMI